MKIIFFAMMISAVLIHSYAFSAQTNETYSEGQLAGMAAELSRQTPERFLQSIQTIKEATAIFFYYMSCSNHIPSIATNQLRSFTACSDPPTLTNDYPLHVKIKATLKDAPPRLHIYMMEKSATNMPWTMVSGWLTDTNEHKISDLQTPSKADEIEANARLPKLLDEFEKDDESGQQSCGTNVSPKAGNTSAHP